MPRRSKRQKTGDPPTEETQEDPPPPHQEDPPPPPPATTTGVTSAVVTSTTTTVTAVAEFDALKQQVGALTTATQSIQRSLAALLPTSSSAPQPPAPVATSQVVTPTITSSSAAHPSLSPALLDVVTGNPVDPLVSSVLGKDTSNDSIHNVQGTVTTTLAPSLTPSLTTVTSSPLSPGLHVPLDTGVPGPVKEKIWHNKYIPLKALLPSLHSAPQYTVSLSDSLDAIPTLTLANRSDAKQPLSLDQWTSAFLVFHYIYIQCHPTHSSSLLSYQHLIRTLASRKANWLRYDELFRQYREKCPATPWDTPHMQLYVDALPLLL